jgi:hypothetical protein
MVCILIELVLDSGELIRETHVLIICKDRWIRELSKACWGLFRCWGSLSILVVCLEKLSLEGVAL